MADAFTEARPLILAGLTILLVGVVLRWARQGVTDFLDEVRAIRGVVAEETRPNNGKSIKDGVFGIKQSIETHNEWSRTSHAEQDEKLDKILKRLQ